LEDTTIYSLAETAAGTLLAGCRGRGLARSDDGGITWTTSNEGMDDVSVHCLLQRQAGDILAGTGQGIRRSTDDARSWMPYADELHGHRIFALTTVDDVNVAAGSYTNVWIGTGERWRQVDPGLTP
ncbi:MAG TPA: hypothetical protein PLV68_02895, partial [Ilumatobacteraceae bacterium]|nr:hypothetical protein [Ilumatobacteraceae bacterium]